MKKLLLAGVAIAAMTAMTGSANAAYALVMKGPGAGNPFWAAVEAGAKAKGAELGVEVVVVAPPAETDVQAQVTQVEDLIAQGVEGIALATDRARSPRWSMRPRPRASRWSSSIRSAPMKASPSSAPTTRSGPRSPRSTCATTCRRRRCRDPAGRDGALDRAVPRQWVEGRARSLRAQRRGRADRRMGPRQGALGDREHPRRQPQHQGHLRVQRQHGARRRGGAEGGGRDDVLVVGFDANPTPRRR